MEYFVIGPDGSKYGPATVATLITWVQEGRLTRETMLENATTLERVRADSISGLFPPDVPTASSNPYDSLSGTIGAPGGPFSSPSPNPMGTYQQPVDYGRSVAPPPNNLVKAIFSTLCCCFPLGVVAIVFAAQVDTKARSGDMAGALDCSNKANQFANIGIVVGLISGVVYFVLGIVGSAFGG